MNTKKAKFPSRRVLDGVPQVNFYEGGPRCPEDLCLPSVLRALGEYFEEDEFGCRTCRAIQPGCKINCSYSFFVGVTGVGSFLSWKEGWKMFADPAVRCEMVPVILEAKKKDAQAIEHIENAISLM